MCVEPDWRATRRGFGARGRAGGIGRRARRGDRLRARHPGAPPRAPILAGLELQGSSHAGADDVPGHLHRGAPELDPHDHCGADVEDGLRRLHAPFQDPAIRQADRAVQLHRLPDLVRRLLPEQRLRRRVGPLRGRRPGGQPVLPQRRGRCLRDRAASPDPGAGDHARDRDDRSIDLHGEGDRRRRSSDAGHDQQRQGHLCLTALLLPDGADHSLLLLAALLFARSTRRPTSRSPSGRPRRRLIPATVT